MAGRQQSSKISTYRISGFLLDSRLYALLIERPVFSIPHSLPHHVPRNGSGERFFECEFMARRIRVRGTSHTNRFTVASHGRAVSIGMHLVDVHLVGVHLVGVHLVGVYLIGVHLTGMYLIGMYGPASQHASHRHASYGHASRGRASHGHASAQVSHSCSLGGL
jgi:hypothetical protein